MVALVTMFIDHVGAAVLSRLEDRSAAYHTPYLVSRYIGRLAFPIFCFLLVEGFLHTRSVAKYARNLFIFGLISEIPFNLALYGKWIQLDIRYFLHGSLKGTHQNVFFTLLIGLVMMAGMKLALEKEKWRPGNRFLVLPIAFLMGAAAVFLLSASALAPVLSLTRYTFRFIMMAVIAGVGGVILALILGKNADVNRRISVAYAALAVLIACVAATWFAVDYGGFGVLVIAVMYVFQIRMRVAGFAAGCLLLTVMNPMECAAMLAVPLVALYNGQRGWKLKYFFYLFYPLHFIFLYLVCIVLKIT